MSLYLNVLIRKNINENKYRTINDKFIKLYKTWFQLRINIANEEIVY